MDPVLGGTIVIPQGKIINFSTVTITKQNVRVTGRGTLKGKLIINCSDTYKCNVSIDGVRFDTTDVAIEVQKGRRFHISNCVFENCDKAIYINPDVGAAFHSISIGNISHNEFFEVNYALYVDKQSGVADRFFQVNDFTFTDNTVAKAYICHVYAKEIDGIIISGNTFFFPSASDVQNATKTYNIYIKNSDWVVISDNNLFESGYESIYLDYVTHPTISNNNIAWCGQRQPSSGILVNYSGGTTLQAFIKISGNNISKATKHGIELIGVSYGSLTGNVIECQLTNYAYYYGVTDLSTISHYGAYINNADTTASLKLVISNSTLNTSESNRTSYINLSKIDISDTRTTFDSEGLDQINLVQPSATVVTDITNGFIGKRIKLYAFNSNTTIQYNSSKFVFRGNGDINIPNGGVLTLEYYSGKWYEISRSFPTLSEPYVSLDITDTRTTIDATSILNFNLIQSSATTVTAISGGVNGKIVTLQAFNGNTTIQYGASTILLKGAVNVTIPNTGILTLRYYAGKWYETSRSF
jgi:parallel beta-helix repeat protein